MTRCLVCNQNESIHDQRFGFLPCQSCQERQRQYKKPNHQIEFTSSTIKEERKQHSKDILQPYRGETLSREYVEAHGYKGLIIEPEDLKKMKYVWTENNYYNPNN